VTTDAQRLRALAKDFRELLDEPRGIANGEQARASWQGPNATDVRGQLRVWRSRLDIMADAIEQEATDSTEGE
jgi:hypothetical protein